MSNFTYEKEDRKSVLETYEWDNLWIENTDNHEGKRVLYVGDSISCGTRRTATALSKEAILFDGFGTSKAVDNPFFKQGIRLFQAQLPKTDVILFNNGLHGFHLEDLTEYKEHYEEMVKFFLEEFKEIPLVLLLTTHINEGDRVERVKARNKAVLNIAEKYGLPVIDLYTLTAQNQDKLSEDGVHFKPEGYEMISEELISFINKNY